MSPNQPTTEQSTLRKTLTELPPSAKLVYKVLEHEGPLTQGEIATESRLCSRTVRYALSTLEDGDVVNRRSCLDDARQWVYWIDRVQQVESEQ